MAITWNATRHSAKSIFETIGRTPMVQLNVIPKAEGVKGKILVKREEFDHWLSSSHIVNSPDGLIEIVDSVVAHMRPSKRSA